MSSIKVAGPVDIAVSGLKAQALRMNVIATNIANASTSRTPSGQPYRRQEVLVRSTGAGLAGVVVGQVVPDTQTDFKRVLQPGHPDADPGGYVRMPNVDLPVEMMSLVTASRAYQANAAVLKRFQDHVDTTLELLR
ncbi:MAG: flagellar basal body rod protein FlgC [Planctomycetes bacterium]|nr:flagellar basal body rod protein FlgC [Planctomycetota bacterium]